MKSSLHILLIAVLFGALALTACSGGEPEPPAAPGGQLVDPPPEYSGMSNPKDGDAAAAEAGKASYDIYCASCHGPTGKGDGPAAGSLDPAPQNLAQNQAKMSDGYIFWRISEGGLIEPFKSAMPAWKDVLDEAQIWQLVTYLRTLDE